MRVHILLVNI